MTPIQSIETKLYRLVETLNLRATLERAADVGDLLLEAKEHLEHGEYVSWLTRFGLHRRTAWDYVAVAKARNRNVWPATDLTIKQFLKWMRRITKDEQRNERAELLTETTEQSGIITGDCLKWMKKRKAGSVSFIVSDPPYGIGVEYDGWKEPENAEAYWQWLQPYWDEMTRIVRPGGSVLLWQSYRHLTHLETWFPGCKIFADCFLIRSLHRWHPMVFWQKEGTPLLHHAGPNDWLMGSQSKISYCPYAACHPCVKPLADCRQAIQRYTQPGSLVLDPFAGTGAISAACQLEGRKFIGIEQSAAYADLARKRLAEVEKAA